MFERNCFVVGGGFWRKPKSTFFVWLGLWFCELDLCFGVEGVRRVRVYKRFGQSPNPLFFVSFLVANFLFFYILLVTVC